MNYSVLGKQGLWVTLFLNIMFSNYLKGISFDFKCLYDEKLSDYASIAGLMKCYPLVSISILFPFKRVCLPYILQSRDNFYGVFLTKNPVNQYDEEIQLSVKK